MKTLTTMLAGLCVMAMSTTPALAKGGHEKSMDPAKYVEKLDKKLDLSDQQRTQVEQIVNDHHGRAQQLMNQMESLKQDKRQKINAVLNPEQQEKFEKLQKRHGKRRGRKD